jgi:hypothetical protein
MSIKVKCDMCSKELDEAGALAFDPPSSEDSVTKFHFCVKCWEEILKFVGKRWLENQKD